MPEKRAGRVRASDEAKRRGALADSFARTPAVRQGQVSGPLSGSGPRNARNARNGANPQSSGRIETPGRLTLPSMPRVRAVSRDGRDWRDRPQDAWDNEELARAYEEYDADYTANGSWDGLGGAVSGEYGDDGREDGDAWGYTTRKRERSQARPLPALPEYASLDLDDAPVAAPVAVYAPLPQESAPELAAYRPPRVRPRARKVTERLAQSARDPWVIARLVLALTAAIIGFIHAPNHMGEPSQPLQVARAQAGLAAGSSVTSLVRPETQMMRPDLYDNYAQFQEWSGAACSAAALSEVLTAYGVHGATIGHEIDELGNYISPNGGLLNRHGFVVVAAKHGLRADESNSWSYNQMLYMTEQLGMPVIVNVRISYGYYRFFSGGHFLVVVGGDAQGLRIVDSSMYYIHYLPKSVFYQMFTGYSAAVVPSDAKYSLPAN